MRQGKWRRGREEDDELSVQHRQCAGTDIGKGASHRFCPLRLNAAGGHSTNRVAAIPEEPRRRADHTTESNGSKRHLSPRHSNRAKQMVGGSKTRPEMVTGQRTGTKQPHNIEITSLTKKQLRDRQ